MRGYTLLRNVQAEGGSRLAIFRFEAKIISRGGGGKSTLASASYRTGKYANTGKSAVASAAYRAGAELVDERTGQKSDYTSKKGVMGAAIVLPPGAPAWMQDRSKLWNGVEKVEKRKDAQLARDFILTLPHELSHEQRVALTHAFVQEQFVAKGYAADIAWHSPHRGDSLNHHAHVMVPLRRVEPGGFARTKERPADGVHPAKAWKDELGQLRQAWEDTANAHLAEAGLTIRIDCRSNAAQGIDRIPEPKMGPVALEIERGGRESFAGRDMREVRQHNAEVQALKIEHAQSSAVIISLEAERAKRMEKQAEPIDQAAGKPANHHDQLDREKQALAELEAAEGRARETVRREAEETIKRAEAFKTQAERDAEKATKEREQHAVALEKSARDGKVSSAESRYAISLGSYDIRDPYGSLARAAMTEEALFQKRQNELRDEMATAKTPEARQEIDLRRQIETYDLYSMRETRIAGINEAISGRVLDRMDEREKDALTGHARAALTGRERADEYEAKAIELREQRQELLNEPERRRRAEMAQGLSGLAKDVASGAMRQEPESRKAREDKQPEIDKTAQADKRNERADSERPREDKATTTKDRYAALDRQDRIEIERQEKQPQPEAGRSKGSRSR